MDVVQGGLFYLFWLLAIAAFVLEAWAFFDAVRRPAQAYAAAGKWRKNIWMIILGVAFVVGLGYAVLPIFGGTAVRSVIGILPVAAFLAAALYLADVRPAVRQFGGGRGSRGSGPYGAW